MADFQRHTGWTHDDRDSFAGKKFTHSYRMPGHGTGCRDQSGERANRSGPFHDRRHTRFFVLPDRAENGLLHVFLTPHSEDWIVGHGCSPIGSHAVEPGHDDPARKGNKYYAGSYYSGFDSGRDAVIHKMATGKSPHHKIRFLQWNNTRSFKQCRSGWYAGAGGSTYEVTIGADG
jgi:hypothetical protein